jgi:hypothetical protein
MADGKRGILGWECYNDFDRPRSLSGREDNRQLIDLLCTEISIQRQLIEQHTPLVPFLLRRRHRLVFPLNNLDRRS